MLTVLSGFSTGVMASSVVLVDLGSYWRPGGNWNTINNADKNETVSNLKDYSTGLATSVAYTGSGFAEHLGHVLYWEAGDKDWVVDEAAHDCFRPDTSDPYTVTFSGLGSESWRVELLVSVHVDSEGADYKVDGFFADANENDTPGVNGDDFMPKTDGRDPANWLIWTSVTPTAGSIAITGVPNGVSCAFANAVRLEAVPVVPEPNACALFALGLGAQVTRRRRK